MGLSGEGHGVTNKSTISYFTRKMGIFRNSQLNTTQVRNIAKLKEA